MVNIGEVIREFQMSEEKTIEAARNFIDRLFKKLVEKLKFKKAEMLYIFGRLLMVDESAGLNKKSFK